MLTTCSWKDVWRDELPALPGREVWTLENGFAFRGAIKRVSLDGGTLVIVCADVHRQVDHDGAAFARFPDSDGGGWEHIGTKTLFLDPNEAKPQRASDASLYFPLGTGIGRITGSA